MALNTWTQILVTYDGANQKFYKNGNLLNSVAKSPTLVNSTTNLNIGRHNGGGYYFPGQISEVKIYNRALSATEVTQDYNSRKWKYGSSALNSV